MGCVTLAFSPHRIVQRADATAYTSPVKATRCKYNAFKISFQQLFRSTWPPFSVWQLRLHPTAVARSTCPSEQHQGIRNNDLAVKTARYTLHGGDPAPPRRPARLPPHSPPQLPLPPGTHKGKRRLSWGWGRGQHPVTDTASLSKEQGSRDVLVWLAHLVLT